MVNAYIAQGVNPGAGALQAARTKYEMGRDQEIRSRNAYVQDRAFNAQQEAKEAEHERWVLGKVQEAQTEEQARAIYKFGREDAIRRGFDVSGSPEELPQGLWAAKTQTGGAAETFFNNLTRNLTPEQQRQAALVELGIAPRAMGNADMTLAGGGPGVPTPEQVGAAAGTVAGGKKAGEQAIAMSGDFMEQVPQVRKSISNIETGIQALDEGANSGYVYNMLPSIRQASIELENAANRMGLDVISSVTFGALSEGELRLAMTTAMPRNLPPKELREWLVKRKDAQEKLIRELQQAAIFLGTPGNTPAMWMEQNTTKGGSASKEGSKVGRFTVEEVKD